MRVCYHRGMRRWGWMLVCLIACAARARAADDRDPLARARQLYNQRQFEAAIAAADQARAESGARRQRRSDRGAGVPRAVSRERSGRRSHQRARTAAPHRSRRGSVRSERIEFIVGLGETLYFDGSYGAAASVFESVLVLAGALTPDERERVLDWWASALDRDARPRSEFERQPIYQRIRDRMTAELAAAPASATAAYWISAAARGQGDLQAAWDAAQAGWVRAPLASERGAALRDDLDRLVLRALIPERARQLGQSPDALRLEWERFKERWQDLPGSDARRQAAIDSAIQRLRRLSSSSPMPTSTVSGTFSGGRRLHRGRGRPSATSSALRPRGTSNSSSSWTVRIMRALGVRGERGVDVDHRALHDVGGRALNRQVDGHALGGRAELEVAAVQLRHQPPPPVHRLHDAGRARLFERAVDERADARETRRSRRR